MTILVAWPKAHERRRDGKKLRVVRMPGRRSQVPLPGSLGELRMAHPRRARPSPDEGSERRQLLGSRTQTPPPGSPGWVPPETCAVRERFMKSKESAASLSAEQA